MKDFLDVLLEQMQKPRSTQDEAVYLNRLKSLATTAPPVRPLLQRGDDQPILAATVHTAPDSRLSQVRPDVDLLFFELKDDRGEPRWFRQAKALDLQRVFGRWDALPGEAQVLETIAMGADLYALQASDHDAAALQYLAEVGVDYGVPALLRCHTEEALARALFIKADVWIGLEGPMAEPSLLELPIFCQRKVLLPCRDRDFPIPHQLQHIILHLEY